MKHILYGVALTVIAANLTVLTLCEIGVIDIAVKEKHTCRDTYEYLNSELNDVSGLAYSMQDDLEMMNRNTYGEICGYDCPR